MVVDFETIVCLPKAGNRQRKATKHCALRLRNQVCREAFQKDLEGMQGGTPCKHVDEHHAVCIRAIQDLARRHFEGQKQGPRKHWISLRTWTLMDCVKVLRRLMRMVSERLKREQQRAALVRWRGVPCQMRERAVAAARGREAQLGLALQVFGARVKIAVRRDKRTHLQENFDRAAEAADNGNVDEVYRLWKPPASSWKKVSGREPQMRRLNSADGSTRLLSRDKLSRVLSWRLVERSVLKTESRAGGLCRPLTMRCLISFLSASRGKAPGVDGISAEVLGAGGRPMAMLLQPLFASVCLQRALPIMWKGWYHGDHSEWKEQDERSHAQ